MGTTLEFATNGESDRDDETFIPTVLMWDIHCDGQWMWSGLYPISETDFGCVTVENDGEDLDCTCIYPVSSKSLGDAMDTHHSFNNGARANRYLLSTDANDRRTWRFDISIVSAKCSETLVMCSHEMVPNTAIVELSVHDGWHPAKLRKDKELRGADPEALSRRKCKRRYTDETLVKQSDYYGDEDDGNLYLRNVEKKVVTGLALAFPTFVNYFDTCLSLSPCYWLDKRGSRPGRLHMTLDFTCDSRLFSSMVVNPPPPSQK